MVIASTMEAAEKGFPRVMIYSWEELAFLRHLALMEQRDDVCDAIVKMARQNSVPVPFPGSHETTLAGDDQVFMMRHLPNLFQEPRNWAAEVLFSRYKGLIAKVAQDFAGWPIKSLDPTSAGRPGEAFVTNPAKGERSDPHRDENLTVVFYPAPGNGLVISHNPHARSAEEIANHPVTLVIPGRGDFVVFDGVNHPHIGVSFGVTPDDTARQRIDKVNRLRSDVFRASVTIHNWPLLRIDGKDVWDTTGLASDPKLDGDRVVVGLNYVPRDRVGETELDLLFTQAASTGPKHPAPTR